MTTRRAVVWAVAPMVAVLAACDGSSAGSDTLDASDTAPSDIAPSDTAPSDTALGDGDPDPSDAELSEVTLAATVDPVGRCESTPAASFGRVAWMEGDTLLAGRPSDTGPAQPLFTSNRAGLRRPVVALGREYHPDSQAFVITTASADTSAIEILDHRGNLRAAVDLPGLALPPLVGTTHLVAPVSAESSGIQWVSLLSGALGFTLPLSSPPTTSAAPFGPALLSGGGSHWVVGTGSGLLSVADRYLNRRLEDGPIDPLVTADLPTITGEHALDGTPRGLLILGDRLVVHLERGSTHHLQLFRIELAPDTTTFVPLGSTALPSAPTTQPVGIDCQVSVPDPAFCPKFEVATVVIGGEGWLHAYHLSTGDQIALSAEPITWTGLALGRGGWVAGGGSHWLPADPEPTPGLWLVHPLHPLRPVLEGVTGSACVPPPIWDHGGQLALPVGGELALVDLTGLSDLPALGPTTPLGPASGPSRSGGGDNQNTQRDLDGLACEDGTPRGVTIVAATPANVQGVRTDYPDVLVFGTMDEVPFFQWFAPPEARWRMDPVIISDAASIDQAEVLPDDTFIIALTDQSGHQLLERYSSRQIFQQRTNIGGDGSGRTVLGLVPQGDLDHIIAESPATLALVRELDGRLDEVDFGDAPDGATLRLLMPRQGNAGAGAVMVVVTDSRVIVRRVDGALDELAVEVDSTLAAPRLIEATTDGNGMIRLLLEDGQTTWLWRYDESLVRVGARRLPKTLALITAQEGDSLLILSDGLARLTNHEALGLTRPLPPVGAVSLLRGGHTAFGYSLGLVTPERVYLAAVDILGGSGCLSAGSCTGSRMLGCDFADPCLAVGCEPTTGECREEPAGTCVP